MVDITKGIGNVQDVLSKKTETSNASARKKAEETASSGFSTTDEVSISSEAIDLQRATEAAKSVRERLEGGGTLGLSPDFIADRLDS